MAYAMNFEVYKSMDALETAVGLDDTHFFAQMKYSELLYRLRALERAEERDGQGGRSGGQRLGIIDGQKATAGNPAEAAGRDAEAAWNKPLRTRLWHLPLSWQSCVC